MLSARLSFFQHPSMDELSRDHGTQPLDALMTQWGLSNHDLVEAAGKSFAQLNHKQVQKGRKGRQLTLKMMQKLAAGLNDAIFLSLPKEKREPFEPSSPPPLQLRQGLRRRVGRSQCGAYAQG